MRVGIDFGENWPNSAEGQGNLGVRLYSDSIELKFRSLIGLDAKNVYVKFSID